jgi:hypothetical protein
MEVADDGKTLWASPTRGEPIDLRYLPLGGQAFLAIRPAEIFAHPDGEKVLAAIGPGGKWAIGEIESMLGVPLNDIEQLIVGLYPQGLQAPQVALVARTRQAVALDQPLEAWTNAAPAREGGKKYFKSGDLAYYLPPAGEGRVIAVMQAGEAKDVLGSDGPPALSLDLERLLKVSDASRHFTLLLSPSVLVTSKGMFAGNLERLRDPLERFLGPSVKAVSLSLHLSDAFYSELRVLGSLDQDANQLARRYQEKFAQTPSEIVGYLAMIPNPHAQRIFLQMPLMLSALSENVRIGAENKQAVLNCYLPAAAAHNLIMGAELSLSSQPGTTVAVVASNPGPKKLTNIAEALQKKTSLTFDRNTLEQAINLLADDLGIKIVIIGGDLQLEGITKNQSFGLEERDKPAAEILLSVLKKANKDNKLVYVIKPEQPGGAEAVFITTRTAAEKRGDKLPDIFAGEPSAKKK